MEQVKFRPLLLWIACFSIACIVSWIYRTHDIPFRGDGRHQFFIAERAASGIPPHVSQFSAKHSLAFLLNGVSISAGRLVGMQDVRAVRAMAVLSLVVVLYLVWQIIYQLTGVVVAAAFSLVSILSFQAYLSLVAEGVEPKLLLLVFLLLSIHASVRKATMQVGLWTACSYLCWQPAILVGVVAAPLLAPTRKNGNHVAYFFLGFTIPIVLYEFYFVFHGAWKEQLFQSFVFPSVYMTHPVASWSRAMTDTGWTWVRAAGVWNPLWIFAIAGSVMLVRRARSLQDSVPLFILLFLIAGLVFTFYDHQGYPDMFLLLPPVVLLSGYSCAFLWNREDRFKIPLGRIFCVAGTVLFITGIVVGRSRSPYTYTVRDQEALAKRVPALERECGPVYAIRCADLLSFNHQNNWSLYSAFFRGVPEYLRTMNTHGPEIPWESRILPPVVLVAGKKPLPIELSTILQQKYQEQPEKNFNQQDIRVWLRRDSCFR